MVGLVELRLRLWIDLPVWRGRCRARACRARFTFLPAFVAPAKWHDYLAIEDALAFVSGPEYAKPGAAFMGWEVARETRIENGEVAGPSTSSVRRWCAALGGPPQGGLLLLRGRGALGELRAAPAPPLAAGRNQTEEAGSSEDAASLLLARVSEPRPDDAGPRGKAVGGNVAVGAQRPHESAARGYLGMVAVLVPLLQALGRALLGGEGEETSAGVTWFGVGAWFLDGRWRQRCLARHELAGRVVPAPFVKLVPDMAVPRGGRHRYPPEPP